ncbi:MAG: hypothetical protein K9M02_11710 [Thiohalocapsa sp.]|nr:hypothetical protein [Thiohalocapsa sp.]
MHIRIETNAATPAERAQAAEVLRVLADMLEADTHATAPCEIAVADLPPHIAMEIAS